MRFDYSYEKCFTITSIKKRSDITDYMICKAYEFKKNDECIMDTLYDLFPFVHYKIIYSALQRANERGFVEYGVSLRTAWLTDKGINLIKQTRENQNEI